MTTRMDYDAVLEKVYAHLQARKRGRTGAQLRQELEMTPYVWRKVREKDGEGGRHLHWDSGRGREWDYVTYHYKPQPYPAYLKPAPKTSTKQPTVTAPQHSVQSAPNGDLDRVWGSTFLDNAWDRF